MQKKCAYCGQMFEAKGRARFCCDSHRVMAYRQQHGLPTSPFAKTQPSPGWLLLQQTNVQLQQQISQIQGQLAQVQAQHQQARTAWQQDMQLVLNYLFRPGQYPQHRQRADELLKALGFSLKPATKPTTQPPDRGPDQPKG